MAVESSEKRLTPDAPGKVEKEEDIASKATDQRGNIERYAPMRICIGYCVRIHTHEVNVIFDSPGSDERRNGHDIG